MKKLLSLLAILVIVFAVGCTQAPSTISDTKDIEQPTVEEITEEEITDLTEEIPEDYVGVWLRTGTYMNGALQHQTPATWTLNNTNYTSTGTCINTGQVIYEGGNQMTITLDSTTCPNVSTGATYSNTYEIKYDEERDVETMTVVTGPMMETYDRQS